MFTRRLHSDERPPLLATSAAPLANGQLGDALHPPDGSVGEEALVGNGTEHLAVALLQGIRVVSLAVVDDAQRASRGRSSSASEKSVRAERSVGGNE